VRGEGKDIGQGLDLELASYSSLDLDKDYHENRDLAYALGLIFFLVGVPLVAVLLGALMRL
jgi:hypothetical protein